MKKEQETTQEEKVIIDLMMILLTSQAYQVVESSLYERAKLILKNDFDLVQNLINSLSKD